MDITRKVNFGNKIIFIDGQPGCGKTMLAPIISALSRVELLKYSYEIEYICMGHYLKKIERDIACALVGMHTDLAIYNLMMSREVNFRLGDLSSVFSSIYPFRYIRRLFAKGDSHVPARIKKENPILALTTHLLTGMSEPIFKQLGDRVVFIEVVRHPVYMIKQQELNMERLIRTSRDFIIYYEKNGKEFPFWTLGWDDKFEKANNLEKAVLFIKYMDILAERTKESVKREYNAQIITIPFEKFVFNPQRYLDELTAVIGTSQTKITRKMMKRQKVPRKKIADGLSLPIYKRCGWKKGKKSLSEKEELVNREKYIEQKIRPEIFKILKELSVNYENKYGKFI